MRGSTEIMLFNSLLGVDFSGRLHGGAMDLADLQEQLAKRAPPRLHGLRTRAIPSPQQRAEPLPQLSATMPPHQPPSLPQAMPEGQAPPMQHQKPAMAMQNHTPGARQRKLEIRKLDGTEVPLGLGSGFFEWGKKFCRQVELVQ